MSLIYVRTINTSMSSVSTSIVFIKHRLIPSGRLADRPPSRQHPKISISYRQKESHPAEGGIFIIKVFCRCFFA